MAAGAVNWQAVRQQMDNVALQNQAGFECCLHAAKIWKINDAVRASETDCRSIIVFEQDSCRCQL